MKVTSWPNRQTSAAVVVCLFRRCLLRYAINKINKKLGGSTGPWASPAVHKKCAVKRNFIPTLLATLLIIGIVFTIDIKIMTPSVGDLIVRTDIHIAEVSPEYLSVAIDSGFICKENILDFINKKHFQTMVAALSPSYLRVGGNYADLLVFEENKCSVAKDSNHHEQSYYEEEKFKEKWESGSIENSGQIQYPTMTCCMSGDEWMAINHFANMTGLTILFDLNVLLRDWDDQWNSTNAKQLLDFSQNHGLHVDWQLGNEPNHFLYRFGYDISPNQLAKDFKTLSALLSTYPMFKNAKLVGPDVTRPVVKTNFEMPSTTYLSFFLQNADTVLSAVTWHQYYFNGRNATLQSFLNPSVLDKLSTQLKIIQDIVLSTTSRPLPIWLSETSSAYGGGAPGLSDRFAASFMWLDKIGLAATYNMSVVIRQTLVGSYYGLIDFQNLEPNPDFWVSIIYKKLVGRKVLQLQMLDKDPMVRLYAHCATKSAAGSRPHAIVIFGMNLGGDSHRKSLSAHDNTSSWVFDLELYELTPTNNSVLSKAIQLNGKHLKLTPSGNIPEIKPVLITDKSILLPPHSIIFVVVHGMFSPTCLPQR